MGPFRVTQPNPTHQLTDPTQPMDNSEVDTVAVAGKCI